jgi:hypothetical protein
MFVAAKALYILYVFNVQYERGAIMTAAKPTALQKVRVSRSQLRQNQSKIFKQARGRRVIEVTAWDEEDEKYVVDKRYFNHLLHTLRSTLETLEITANQKLFGQLVQAANTIDTEVRSGKLHSFEEAFGQP